MSTPAGADAAVCRCGHPRPAHEHYRNGSECSLCDGCPRYRPQGGLLARLRAALGR